MSQGLQLSAVLNELLYGNEVMESVEQTLDRLVTFPLVITQAPVLR
jgi:hypothetical protein